MKHERISSKYRSELVLLGVSVSSLAGAGALYMSFEQQQTSANPTQEIHLDAKPNKMREAKDTTQKIAFLQQLEARTIEDAPDTMLLNKAESVQEAVFALSERLHTTDGSVMGMLPDETVNAFEARNVHFTLVSSAEENDDCLNTKVLYDNSGAIQGVTVPLREM